LLWVNVDPAEVGVAADARRVSCVLVFMSVMQVRIVRMLVQKPRVPVPMAMRLAGRRVRRVFMLMMDVMYMAMFMLERFMQMLVVVRFSDVQINANTHQQRRAYESEGRCLTKQRERKGCTDEGSRREVGAGARSS